MHGKVNRPSPFLTVQMMCEEASRLNGECVTRKMTAEDWLKYGPLKLTKKNIMKNNMRNS
ncbi:MAG TPA: hypothetical protein VN370_13280 [Desulfitobacteriaceae bacterium]|nr:hypothetical protein [Desulfitobacteriaceae bacterium]